MAQRVDVQYIKFYTQGSAAARVQPAKPAHTATLPKIKKRTVYRVCVDPVAMLGIAVAVCMLIMMAVGVSNFRKERQKTVVMERYVALLQQENEELQARYEAERDLEMVEKTARALGMVPKEQIESVSIQVKIPEPQVEVKVSIWDQLGTFLTGLFA